MATPFKGDPMRILEYRTFDGLSDIAADCRGYNAVHVAVYVSGTSPSATITVEGSESAAGGNYQVLPDPNATQRSVSANAVYEVNVGSAFVRARLADISGTFGRSQGYTVVLTPYVSAGSRQRPLFYDRNPVSKGIRTGIENVSPHAFTVWQTYTVPSGKKAIVELVAVAIRRRTAASSAGAARAQARFLNTSGSVVNVLDAVLIGNTVDDRIVREVGMAALLVAGESIDQATVDGSTNGAVDYYLDAKITEFDA